LIAKHGDKAVNIVKDTQKLQTDRLYVDGIKSFSDGSYPLLGSLVNFPGYLDGDNGQQGDSNLVEIMKPFWNAGYQLHCHANGDQAVDITLGALAELQKECPRFDHRFAVEHYSMSTPMQARRLKALGGIASVNAYFIHYRSLQQGKFADFTILEEDPFEVDPKEIENIKIWGTVLGGKPFKAKEA
jgi:predicted amidohydrolase YtcJ